MTVFGCVAPVNSSYESARTLGKGNMEFMGLYSHYIASAEGELNDTNDNFGVRFRYGVSESSDITLRYIFLNSTADESNLNYLALAFKHGLLKNRITLNLPFAAYFDSDESLFFISPKLLFTFPVSEKFETTFASKIDFYLDEDYDSTIGLNLGFGISKDLRRWAIRPEAGLIFDPGEEGVYWSFGVGIDRYFSGKKTAGN